MVTGGHNGVLFACVAEDRPEFARMVQTLAFSIRSGGSSLATAPIVVNVVERVSARFAAPLHDLDVEVRTVARVPGSQPPANKIRMLDLHRTHAFDVLLALDCDTAVIGDPGPFLDAEQVAVKAADKDAFTEPEWQRLFALAGVSAPERRVRATITGQPMYPYFNSGVLAVPQALCAGLGEAWLRRYTQLAETVLVHPGMIRPRQHFFLDQAALALALVADGLAWTELPPAMNLPTHVPLPAAALDPPPVIVHYHSRSDAAGFLQASRTSALDPLLDDFNRRRAQGLAQAYPGLEHPKVPPAARLRQGLDSLSWGLTRARHRAG